MLYDLGATTIRPGLAESWEISEDGLVYTFNLRQGVSFHDGEPFNADAVVTWYNSIDEGAPDSQYDATRMVYIADFITNWIDTVEAVDEFTVRMTLPEPYSPLLANLAIPIAGIVSPAAIAQGLDYVVGQPLGNRGVPAGQPRRLDARQPDGAGGQPRLLGRRAEGRTIHHQGRSRKARPACSRSKPARSISPGRSRPRTSSGRERIRISSSSRTPD